MIRLFFLLLYFIIIYFFRLHGSVIPNLWYKMYFFFTFSAERETSALSLDFILSPCFSFLPEALQKFRNTEFR